MIAALKLLALTFVRPGELRNAHWSEFDLARRSGRSRRPDEDEAAASGTAGPAGAGAW